MVGGTLPKSLSGSSALTLDRIESFGLNGGDEVKAKSEAVLQKFYTQYKDPVAKTALETLGAIKTVRTLSRTEYQPAAQYPDSGLAQAFKTAAQLIKARVGLRFVNIDMGGFDTHTSSKGQLHDHAVEAAGALNAFFQDLGTELRPFVSLLTTTEFGRTVGENGGQGTDHGHGQGVMVLGGGSTGGVRGGDPIIGVSGPDNETQRHHRPARRAHRGPHLAGRAQRDHGVLRPPVQRRPEPSRSSLLPARSGAGPESPGSAPRSAWFSCSVVEVSRRRFEELVGDALDEVPEQLTRLMDNVVVLVEERDPDDPYLLGLYEGVALTERGHDYGGMLPDRITLYRQAILAICETEDDVVDEVAITVVHEIAHHFGIDDARLHELGWG